jgi:hypothetical protein
MSGALEAQALRAWGTHGLIHNQAIWALREYLNTQPERVILKGIAQIEDVKAMNVLLEAGLNATYQQALDARWGIIKKETP